MSFEDREWNPLATVNLTPEIEDEPFSRILFDTVAGDCVLGSKLWHQGHRQCVHVVGGGVLKFSTDVSPGLTAIIEAISIPKGTLMVAMNDDSTSAVVETVEWVADNATKFLCYLTIFPSVHRIGSTIYAIGGATTDIDVNSVQNIVCGFNTDTLTLTALPPMPLASAYSSTHSG